MNSLTPVAKLKQVRIVALMTSFRTHKWILGLVSLALILRALIPLGYMPNLASLANGQIQMVVCTGSGPQMVTVAGDFDPLKKTHPADTTKTEHGLFCAVGLIAHWFSLPIGIVLLFVLAVASVIVIYRLTHIVLRRFDYSFLPFPRGPPLFSI